VISLDAKDAFNSRYWAVLLPAVAAVLERAGAYALSAYGRSDGLLPVLFYRLESGEVRVIWSASGCQQGDPLGPVFFAIAILAAMHAFRATVAASGASLVGYLDDLAVLGMPGDSQLSRSRVAPVQQPKVDLEAVGLVLNMQKSTALSAPGVGAADLS
ncbi:unnamed protein product, partial [Phaeothamnion confervicola]